MSEMYYYGCLGTEAGHRLIDAQGNHISYYRLEQMGPAALKYLDGGFLPRNAARGGIYRSVLPGWTILAMVDNSIDTRPGSNAEFLLAGEQTYADMVTIAKATFPDIVKRLGWQ